MELDKICRLCLTTKKDMRNLFQDNLVNMIEEISNSIKVNKIFTALLVNKLFQIQLFRSRTIQAGLRRFACNASTRLVGATASRSG